MSMSMLSPVISIAGAGMLPNPPADIGVALALPAALGNSVSTYTGVPIVSQLQGIWGNIGNSMSLSTSVSLLTLGASNFPALTGVIPSTYQVSNVLVNGLYPGYSNTEKYVAGNVVVYTGNVFVATTDSQNQTPGVANSAYWTLDVDVYSVPGVVTTDANAIIGGNDLGVFCQVFSSAYGYAGQSNYFINSVNNSEALAATFNTATGGMTTLTTGSLNQVSNDIPALGSDLIKLGRAIDLSTLSAFGLPGTLLAQLGKVTGGIHPAVAVLLLKEGILESQILSFAGGVNSLTAAQEKLAYTALTNVIGSALDQVLLMLQVTTPNITNLAQLLDPTKFLPSSYKSLVCPSDNTLLPVYLPDNSVNTNLIPVVDNPIVQGFTGLTSQASYLVLKSVIPPDQALAVKAFAFSLQQVKSISTTDFQDFAKALTVVETNSGLPLVNSLTSPIPSSVPSTYSASLGSGSGPRGTILLSDVIGVLTLPLFTQGFANVANAIGNINTSSLANVYTYMSNTQSGMYDDPMNPGWIIIPTGPAAGTYTSLDEAFSSGLIPAAQSAISNIAAANPSVVTSTTQIWSAMLDELARESGNQAMASINFGTLFREGISMSLAMSFASGLHQYGTEVAPGGANDIITALANQNSLSGQCVIASLREGRNIAALQETGINLDTQLPVV